MVRFGRKFAGQAQNAPAANAQMSTFMQNAQPFNAQMNNFMQNAQANGFVQDNTNSAEYFNQSDATGRPLTAEQRARLLREVEGLTPELLDAYERGEGTLFDEAIREIDQGFSVGQQGGEVSLNTASGIDVQPDGSTAEVIYVSSGDGTELVARVPRAPAPAPTPVEDECVFQPQHVVLERDINIVSSAPRIIDSTSDVCGNLLSYKEQMTRTMTAGPWVPTSGMNGSAGQFVVEDNGEVSLLDNPGADIANSAGFGDITWNNTNTGANSIGSRVLPNGQPAPAPVAGRRRRGNNHVKWAGKSMNYFRSA